MKYTIISTFFVIIFLFFCNTILVQSQSDKVLLTINGDPIYKREFERLYNKHIEESLNETKSPKEFLELFIDLKLKVKEAKALRFDTTTQFLHELNNYRKQLVIPYLFDKKEKTRLAKEAYERLKTEIHIKLILVRVDTYASAADSLIAYRKAMNIRRNIMSGVDFETVARRTSDDPSVSKNGGDWWYVSVFRLPYTLENYIYQAEKGTLSMPIRTENGYYIVRIMDKRPARGELKVAHIMISLPSNADSLQQYQAKQRIDTAYTKLRLGESFEELVKQYSNDKSTCENKGELPWLRTGYSAREFEKQAFALKNKGDFTKVFRTSWGWHIVRLIDRKAIYPYENIKQKLYSLVENDSRILISKHKTVNKLKKTYNYEDYRKLTEFYFVVDTTIFDGKWNIEKANDIDEVMFLLAGKSYTQQDFAAFLEQNQIRSRRMPIDIFVNQKYRNFVSERILAEEERHIETKNEEFRYLMQEFYDGILLFAIVDQQIWSKAENDSVGQYNHYKSFSDRFLNIPSYELAVFSYSDETALKELRKILKKKNLSPKEVEAKINKKKPNRCKLIEDGVFDTNSDLVQKNLTNIKKTQKKEIIELKTDKKLIFVANIFSPSPLPYQEVKWLVLADYQVELERKWNMKLRKKYDIKINKSVLSEIK